MLIDAISHITAAYGLVRIDARAVTGPGRQGLAGVILIPLTLAEPVVRGLRSTVERAEATRRKVDPAAIPATAGASISGSLADPAKGELGRAGPALAERTDQPPPPNDRTLLVEEIKSLSLSGGIYRIDCFARGGDGKSRLSGALLIPEERMAGILTALETMLAKLSSRASGGTTNLATVETVGSA
ncbi:MAG: hypothetical protein KDA49_07510 [Rhodospirillaceae bacterium]|nr:hypothetical protein [Rhodospirillaceae bacterium]